MLLERFLDVAQKAAREAGGFLLASLGAPGEARYKGAGHRNPSTRTDEKAEELIINAISHSFPDHGFISEEKGKVVSHSDYEWIIDPLDGTVNFIHKYRCFAVSIALAYRGDVVLGAIYNPLSDEMFTAVRGEGAFRNGKGIQVSLTSRLDESLLAFGFPYGRSSKAFARSLKNFARLVRDSQAVRRDGSTALDLCHVACGVYDGFCVSGNEIWDYAAGTLIVAEAGGRVTDFRGNPFRIAGHRQDVLATNGKLHNTILSCLQNQPA